VGNTLLKLKLNCRTKNLPKHHRER